MDINTIKDISAVTALNGGVLLFSAIPTLDETLSMLSVAITILFTAQRMYINYKNYKQNEKN